jgi:hypothetical protein
VRVLQHHHEGRADDAVTGVIANVHPNLEGVLALLDASGNLREGATHLKAGTVQIIVFASDVVRKLFPIVNVEM